MLFGSTVLEVAIGMIFVYLLLSLLCSAVSEYIEAKMNNRAKDLERGIRMLLNDDSGEGLAKMLYAHPLVKGLYRDGDKLPSYIPSRTFALALWNMATTAAAGAGGASSAGVTNQLQTIRAAVVANVPDERIRTAVLTLIDEAGGNLDRARRNIEDWYDGAMDRVSGWYKRRVQIILLVIGFLVAAAINADTVTISKALVQDGALRAAVVAEAETAGKNPPPANTPGVNPAQKFEETRAKISALGLPIGWAFDKSISADPRGRPDNLGGWILKFFGLLLTGFAISQGAPFWFDLLNKFMVIRSTVKPKEKSAEQPSKDQPAPETETTTVNKG